jgi:rhodanese-related sulfurtransferase
LAGLINYNFSKELIEMTGIQTCIVTLAALLLLGCGPKEEQFVDVQTAFARQEQGELLLDIREGDDYTEFHIPKSMNMPFGRLKLRLAELEPYKGKTIMVIDHTGQRAPRALELLQSAGFSQVFVVKGGMIEWKAAGLPIEKLDMRQLQQQ